MKLNHDCMRDCLLYLEAKENIHVHSDEDDVSISFDPIFIGTIFNDLKNWTNHDIFYALFNLKQGGYIETRGIDADDNLNEFCVDYITFSGHEFLDSVRDDTRWSKIKAGLAGKVRDYSLSAISAFSSGMTSAAINAFCSGQLNL